MAYTGHTGHYGAPRKSRGCLEAIGAMREQAPPAREHSVLQTQAASRPQIDDPVDDALPILPVLSATDKDHAIRECVHPRVASAPQAEAVKLAKSASSSGNTLAVFTDGSALTPVGPAGAGVVLMHQGVVLEERAVPLAPVATVMDAELHGIFSGLVRASSVNLGAPNIRLFSDSSAALQAICRVEPSARTLQVRPVLRLLRRLRNSGRDVQVHWVPAHVGVSGNERADRQAKEAARLASQGQRDRLHRVPLPSMKALIGTRVREEWRLHWANHQDGRHLYALKPAPARSTPSIFRLSCRMFQCIMARLRSAHSRLHAHLARLNIIQDASCPHCPNTPETPDHLLLRCPHYNRARAKLLNFVAPLLLKPRLAVTCADLLGRSSIPAAQAVQAMEATAKFVRATGRPV